MKILKYTLIISGLMLTLPTYAQKSPESPEDKTFSESLSFSLGIGSANYYGDLMKNSGVF